MPAAVQARTVAAEGPSPPAPVFRCPAAGPHSPSFFWSGGQSSAVEGPADGCAALADGAAVGALGWVCGAAGGCSPAP